MKTDDAQGLSNTFCRVIEQLAFMFVEPAEKSKLPTDDKNYLAVRIDFKGARQGALRLAVPAAMCVELAGNMLGTQLEDDQQAAAKGLDALKEVLNVTCGNILTDIAGDQAVFTLGIPESIPLDTAGWAEFLGQPGTQGFLIDEHPALLQFQMEGSIA
jgi:hypothetical protein